MNSIALYGGSFDPPHMGHVTTISTVLNSRMCDELWVVPSGYREDKHYKSSNDDRKAMIALMLYTMFGSQVPVKTHNIQIDEFCIESSAIRLIDSLNSSYNENEYSFVIGSDLVASLKHWKSFLRLTHETHFLVVPRLGCECEELPNYASLVPAISGTVSNISSSMVREMVKEGKALEGIVPPAVINYIIRNELYRN